jgi:hypothetical protein
MNKRPGRANCPWKFLEPSATAFGKLAGQDTSIWSTWVAVTARLQLEAVLHTYQIVGCFEPAAVSTLSPDDRPGAEHITAWAHP